MLVKRIVCIRTLSLSLGLLVLTITSSLYALGWNPKEPQSAEEAQIIGNWVGELFGKPVEVTLWPSPEVRRLTGTMILNSCITSTGAGLSRTPVSQIAPSFPDEISTNRIFDFGVTPEGYIRTGEPVGKSGFRFSNNNNCSKPPDPYPMGYPIEQIGHRFFFVSDESHTSLTVYTQETGEAAVEKHETLTRSEPSAQMSAAIEELSSLENYKQDKTSEIVIHDPSKRYLDVLVNAKFVVNGVDINNTDFLTAENKDWYYFRDKYDMKMAAIISNILWGEFKPAYEEPYYFYLYKVLLETHAVKCEALIDNKSTIKTKTTTTTRKPYYATEYETNVGYVEVDSRYVDAYIEARERMDSPNRVTSYGLEYMTVLIPMYVNRFFDSEKCSSPTSLRFMENYYRSMVGKPALQN
jgi:hypothetical protein